MTTPGEEEGRGKGGWGGEMRGGRGGEMRGGEGEGGWGGEGKNRNYLLGHRKTTPTMRRNPGLTTSGLVTDM